MKIGLALGSGSSRGWSHIGVINALAEVGIFPQIVCGTSVGAMVGAAHAFNNLSKLEEWARSVTKFDTAKFFDFNASLSGFVDKKRFHRFLNEYVAGDSSLIENASIQYGAVATDLGTGREVWFTTGAVLEAVWASMAMPGLFPAIKHHEAWLVDGGLVNPVPVSACRALGADIVIAVNLNGDIVGKHFQKQAVMKEKENGLVEKFNDLVTEYTTALFPDKKEEEQPPNLFEAIAGSVNIIQDRITRNRMAGDPPDIVLSPKLSQIGLLELYRADEAIEEGNNCVRRMLPEISYILDLK